MNVRKLRLQRNWSQEQLAQVSGLSIRTIQRIERGQTPGLESVKSLVHDQAISSSILGMVASTLIPRVISTSVAS